MSENIQVTRTGYGHGPGGIMSKPALDKKGGVAQTMHEFKHGQLHSGSKKGPKVRSRAQALAIALNSKAITAAQRKRVPASDFAGPHDSFPIRNQTDVNSAARLSGHAANPGAVRSAIKRIAKRKGLKLPKSWTEKAANYGARAGETIAGNLKRGANGKFASAGEAQAAADAKRAAQGAASAKRGASALRAVQPKPTKPGKFKPPKAGGGKKGAGKKGGKAKAPPKPKAGPKLKIPTTTAPKTPTSNTKIVINPAKPQTSAAPSPKVSSPKAAPKPKAPAKPKAGPKPKAPKLTPAQRQAAQAAAQKLNLTNTAGKLAKPELGKLFNPANPNDVSALTGAKMKALIDAGLAVQHANGALELNAVGRALVRAMQSGNVDAANRLIAHAQGVNADQAAKLAARQAKLAAQQAKHKEHSLHIVKDANGNYRWITFSSSSYEDKDGETIAQKALEMEVERAERTGQYGPLCWWHCNGIEKGVPLIKLGDCDFSTMVGRILVESGTFVNEAIAKAISKNIDLLGTSIGFIPYPAVRGEGVVFKNIAIKERSLLPAQAASNYLANKVFIGKQPDQEVIMSKIQALKAFFGGGKEADDLVNSIVQEASVAEKAAQNQGLAYKQAKVENEQVSLATAILKSYGFAVVKEDMSKADPDILPQGESGKKMSKTDPAIQDNAKAGTSKPNPDIQKDDGMVEEAAGAMDPSMMAGPDGENAEPDDDEGGYEDSEGDNEIDALIQALHDDLDIRVVQAVTEALQPISEGLQTALNAATETATKEAGVLVVVKGQIEALTKAVAALQTEIKTLQGEAPLAIKQGPRGGRVTEGNAQLVSKEAADQLAAVTSEPTVDPYAIASGKLFNGLAQHLNGRG